MAKVAAQQSLRKKIIIFGVSIVAIGYIISSSIMIHSLQKDRNIQTARVNVLSQRFFNLEECYNHGDKVCVANKYRDDSSFQQQLEAAANAF